MSGGNLCTAKAGVVVFNGQQIGDSLHSYVPVVRRANDISVRSCLFSNSTRIRDPYPSRYLEHTLVVYQEYQQYSQEATSPSAFTARTHSDDFFALLQYLGGIDFSAGGKNLTYAGKTFPGVFLEDFRISSPDTLGLHRAGFWELVFVGPLP